MRATSRAVIALLLTATTACSAAPQEQAPGSTPASGSLLYSIAADGSVHETVLSASGDVVSERRLGPAGKGRKASRLTLSADGRHVAWSETDEKSYDSATRLLDRTTGETTEFDAYDAPLGFTDDDLILSQYFYGGRLARVRDGRISSQITKLPDTVSPPFAAVPDGMLSLDLDWAETDPGPSDHRIDLIGYQGTIQRLADLPTLHGSASGDASPVYISGYLDPRFSLAALEYGDRTDGCGLPPSSRMVLVDLTARKVAATLDAPALGGGVARLWDYRPDSASGGLALWGVCTVPLGGLPTVRTSAHRLADGRWTELRQDVIALATLGPGTAILQPGTHETRENEGADPSGEFVPSGDAILLLGGITRTLPVRAVELRWTADQPVGAKTN